MGLLRHRLAMASGAGVAGVLLLLVLVFHLQQRAQLLVASGADLLRQQQRVARGIDQTFARTEQRAAELEVQVRHVRPNPAQLVAMLEAKLLHDGESVQFGIMLEADNPVTPGRRYAIGEYYAASGPRTVDFVQNGYDYWNKPWYREALRRSGGDWSEVYFNEAAGGIDTLTYDHPLRDAQGHAYGVLSISLSLDRIADITATEDWRHAEDKAHHLLVDARGRILQADDPAVERAYTVNAVLVQRQHPLVAWVARQPPARVPRQAHAASGPGVMSTYVLVPVPRVGWRVAARMEDAQVLQTLWRTTWAGLALALLLGLLAAALVVVLQERQRRSLLALSEAVEHLGNGHLDAPLPAAGTLPEVARLARAFERSRQTLLQHSGQARTQRDACLREEGRRDLARRLQLAQLPVDRVLLGNQLQVHACGGLRMGRATDTCFYGHLSPAPGVFTFYLGTLAGDSGQGILQLGRSHAAVAHAARVAHAPSALLAALMEPAAALPAGDVPMALLVGSIDLEQHALALAAAGAGGALLLRDGRQQVLPLPEAPALRRDAHGPWRDWRGDVAAGDRLLLFSPTLRVPASASGNPLRSLQVAVERHADLPAPDMLEAVLAAVDAEVPALAECDRALLLLDIRHRD